MKLSLESNVRRSNKVVSHEFDGAVYFLDPRKNTVRVLNDTAGFIWNSIKTRQTAAAVADKLTKAFKVSRKQAENDILRYLSKLIQLKYVKRDGSGAMPAGGCIDN